MGKKRGGGRRKKKKANPPQRAIDFTDKACTNVAARYTVKSNVSFDDMRSIIEREIVQCAGKKQKHAPLDIDNPKFQRLCAMFDPSIPPKASGEGFRSFLLALKHTATSKRSPYDTTLLFKDEEDTFTLDVRFASLRDYCVFAYNPRWRKAWRRRIAAPTLPLPAPYEVALGDYIGSWADYEDYIQNIE